MQVNLNPMEQSVALSEDRGLASLSDPQDRLVTLEARSEVGDASLLRRVTQLELELERATASLRTQGAMLRNAAQDQAARVVRAREVQALTAADLDGRLTAMEHLIHRLLSEVDAVRQEQSALRGPLGPLRRLGSSSFRRVSSWLPTRASPAPAVAVQEPRKPKDDEDSTAMLLLRGLPAAVKAWKELLGKRR